MIPDPADDSKGFVVIACDDGRTGRIALMREIAGAMDGWYGPEVQIPPADFRRDLEKTKEEIGRYIMGTDPASGPSSLVLFVVDAGDVRHILPEAEAREWAADGHSIRKLPPKKPGEYLPDHVWNIPVMAAKATSDVSYPAPNAGKQAPPPRREWWSAQWKGKGTPGNGCQRRDKSERKQQKEARKANRRKK